MENLTSLTRLEQFLAKIAGDDIELPEVKTRLEYWLKEISENGGGGGGGSSGLVVNIIEIPTVDPEGEPTYRYDKTAKEIVSAFTSGQLIYVREDYHGIFEIGNLKYAHVSPDAPGIAQEQPIYAFVDEVMGLNFGCDNENEYPYMYESK